MTNILQDGYNRKIDYLRISVTDRCNMRCIYCMPEDGISECSHQSVLRYEEISLIVDAALQNGINKFRLTGGEPLVRKGIIDFIRELSKKPGVQEISLTTNGMLLEEYALSLKEAGLSRVNISVDSLNPEMFRKITRTDALDKVMRGIDAALASGLKPVKINTVAMKENFNEVCDFAALTIDKDIHIRFIEFMPIGNSRRWAQEGYISSDKIMQVIEARYGTLEHINKMHGNGPAIYYKLPGAIGTIGFISAMSHHFCKECNRLRLTADGKLRACLTRDDEVDIKSIVRNGGGLPELTDAFVRVIAMKPEEHSMGCDEATQSQRRMPGIGG